MNYIKTIKGYDVTFIKQSLGSQFPEWICAYVKLTGKLDDNYSNETYRELNVIGIDTNHMFNQKQSIEERYKDAERQITEIIGEHISSK